MGRLLIFGTLTFLEAYCFKWFPVLTIDSLIVDLLGLMRLLLLQLEHPILIHLQLVKAGTKQQFQQETF